MVRHLLSKNQTRNKNKESFQRDGGSYCMPFNVIKMVDVYFDAKRLRQLFLHKNSPLLGIELRLLW